MAGVTLASGKSASEDIPTTRKNGDPVVKSKLIRSGVGMGMACLLLATLFQLVGEDPAQGQLSWLSHSVGGGRRNDA
jgi:hypothetical protein